MFFSMVFIFMMGLNNPFCDHTKDSLKDVDYGYSVFAYKERAEVFDFNEKNEKIELNILSENIKSFFQQTNLAIVQNKNMQPYIIALKIMKL